MDKLLFNKFLLLLGFLLLLAPFKSPAIEVDNLYRVKINVEDQSSGTRWRAVLQGFKEVLVRKSGSQDVLDAYEVQQAYRKVTAYLQRFEYNSNTVQGEEKAFELLLDFEPRLVDELIQEAGMPIWGSNRPLSILWLAIEENFKRQMIKEDIQPGSLAEIINTNSIRRGLPIILPLMDLEDQLNVAISDVWGRFNSPVRQASERYAADAIISGRISQVGGNWQAKLTYLNEDIERRLEFNENNLKQLLETLTNRLAELLCEKYCVVEIAEQNQIVMQVSNIGNFKSFKKVQNYLQGLSSIRKVEVDKIAGLHVRFNIGLLGNLQAVKEGVGLGNNLIEESAPQVDPFASTDVQVTQDEYLLTSDEESSTVPIFVDDLQQTGSDDNTEMLTENVNLTELPSSEVPTEVLYYRWVE